MGYFETLSQALDRAGIDQPVLVLDKARLDANLAQIRTRMPQGRNLRIADKSLAAPQLLTHVMDGLGARDLMSFDPGVTRNTLALCPEAQILMGKPLPVRLAAHFMLSLTARDRQRVTWLIDSAETLQDYAELALECGETLNICVEVNTGLGRGGFEAPEALKTALTTSSNLNLRGAMGYEPQAGALPKWLGGGAKARDQAEARFAQFVEVLPPSNREILNIGGSGTLLNITETIANDFTLGSLAVKPSDFDQVWNASIQPALFIAAPVLRHASHILPNHPKLSRVLQSLRVIKPRVALTYGGNWRAQIVHPKTATLSPFLGNSNNQQGWAHRSRDDFSRVFLRPAQCDAILQNFGAMVVFDGAEISAIWPTFAPGSAHIFNLPQS